MKKFLSFLLAAILVMAMGTVAFADEVDLGIKGNGPIDLTAYTDGTIKVVVSRYQKSSGDITNYGIGGLCPPDSWSVAADFSVTIPNNPEVGETAEYTWDIAQVKAALGDKPVVNFYNDMKIDSVVIITGGAAPTGDATPITAIAIIALASCAAMVVLRKREA